MPDGNKVTSGILSEMIYFQMNYFLEIIVKNNLFMYHIDVTMGFISFRNLNFSEALSEERGSSNGDCAAVGPW